MSDYDKSALNVKCSLGPQQRNILRFQSADGGELFVDSVWSVQGDIERTRLIEAVKSAIASYPILSYRFSRWEGERSPTVGCYRHNDIDLIVNDAARDNESECYLIEADYNGSCLVRVTCANDGIYYIAVKCSSLNVDLKSIEIFVAQVFKEINESSNGLLERDEIPEYIKIAEWENNILAAESVGGAKFEGGDERGRASNFLVPGENSAPENLHFQPARVIRDSTEELFSKIRSQKVSEKFTLKSVCLAAWFLTLRLAGNDTVSTISVGMDGRYYDELKRVVGPMTRFIPLKAEHPREVSCRDVINEINQKIHEAEKYQYYFSREELSDTDVPDPLAYAFLWQNELTLSENNLSACMEDALTVIDRYRLQLIAFPKKTRLTFSLNYDENRFDVQYVEWLLACYLTVLEHLLEDKDQSVNQLGGKVGGHRQVSLVAGHATQSSFPENALCYRIAMWAGLVSDRIAIHETGGSLSYGNLERQSNRLANYLRKLHIDTEDRVGIQVSPTAEMIISMLAVLKVGGVYVPVDCDLPEERILAQVQDSSIKVLICEENEDMSVPAGVRVWKYSEETLLEESVNFKPATPRPEGLAYIIYTSGSTGESKGVMVTHEGMMNYLSWCSDNYDMAAGPSLLYTSASFDMSVTALWGALFAGQALHLVAKTQGVDALLEALTWQRNYSVVKITPTHLRMINKESERLGNKRWCRCCILGGEALYAKDVIPWGRNNIRFINEYGPTETVVGSSAYEVTFDERVTVPIGQPINNTRIYLTDDFCAALSCGEVGEICIGGMGVARGYHNRPALTAELFVPDRYAQGGLGARVYRTGDLGVVHENGEMTYLGRKDNQRKIRGYRVELEEIENVLLRRGTISQAAVLFTSQNSVSTLVACIVVTENAKKISSDIKKYLERYLPGYMIPGRYVFMEKMPLMKSGKIDRAALLSHIGDADHTPVLFRPDLDDIEQSVALIWRQVLGIESVDITDNFFDVGGDSFLLYEIYGKLKELVGRDFPATVLFEYPTIKGISTYLGAGTENGDTPVGDSNLAGGDARRKLLNLASATRQVRNGNKNL